MSQSSLAAWLKRLEQLHPVEIELGLGRVGQVWQRMATPLSGVRVITVAGTNGKGSTATLTAALLAAHGWRAGLYTSPHFLDFNERIVIAGVPATDVAIVDALERVDAARQAGSGGPPVSLTYFEFTTLAALYLFSRASLDAVVLEVGLGGRLDAVNVIAADCAVVTSIGLDHTDWLGHDLAAIAREKCGIARAHKPLLVGAEVCPEVFADVATAVGAQLRFVTPPDPPTPEGWSFQGARTGQVLSALPPPALPLPSAHLALQVLDECSVVLDPEAVQAVLTRTTMPGRLQTLSYRGRTVVLDVAHNPDAAIFVARQLAARGESWDIILGMLRDKDAPGVVQSLAVLQPRWHLVSLDVSPRGLRAEELAERCNLPAAQQHDSVAAALAKVTAQSTRPVLVCGSFFTVAEALTQIQLDTHGYND